MYSGVRVCIDTLGVICVVLGVGLFAGTKRETLWDRNNLVGLLLVGVALSIHGGFDTILRSSPRATFSGYVLAWSRSSDDAPSHSGWIWLYDLGYPPAKGWGGAPYRALYIPEGSGVPDAAWSTDSTWFLRATYRNRDLQAMRVEGKPVPSAKASGVQNWTWEWNEPLWRPALEAATGFTLMLGAAIGLVRKRGLGMAPPLHVSPYADEVHR